MHHFHRQEKRTILGKGAFVDIDGDVCVVVPAAEALPNAVLPQSFTMGLLTLAHLNVVRTTAKTAPETIELMEQNSEHSFGCSVSPARHSLSE